MTADAVARTCRSGETEIVGATRSGGLAEGTAGDDLTAAWYAAVYELREGWILAGLVFVPSWSKRARRRGPHWRATALRRMDLGLPPTGMVGVSIDGPAAALRRLADLLSGMRRP